jgi:Flp pilus assembly protein CpaB
MVKRNRFFELMQIHPKHFTAVILIGVTIVFVWENKRMLRSPAKIKDPRILVAARDLSEGELLKSTDFQLSSLEDLHLASGEKALSDQEFFMIQGRRLKKSLSRGNPLLFEAVFKSDADLVYRNIPRGRRAYFVETDHLELVQSGDKVDLVLKTSSSIKNTLILVEDVLILSVDKTSEIPGVILALTPEEIEWVEKNLGSGKVVLAVRNPNEMGGRGALKKGKHQNKKRVKVELITEGP